MAVNGEILVYPGQELTPQDFAIMMERISVIRSGILSGCEITVSETEANTLNVKEGYAFVRGRLVKIEQGTLDTSNLSQSAESWFVYVRLHLAEIEPIDLCTIYATDTAPIDATEKFNEIGDGEEGIAYATLATIKVSDMSIKQATNPEIGVVETFTLAASGWATRTETIDGTSYDATVYNLQDPRFSPSEHIELIPRNVGYDYEYLVALQSANIQVFSVGEGTLTLGCYGRKPTNDLNIGVIFRGAL